MDKIFNINKKLIWDYDFEGKYDSPEFIKWYIARVLTNGNKNDIREIGLDTIRKYLSTLNLPNSIRKFWERYFEYINTK